MHHMQQHGCHERAEGPGLQDARAHLLLTGGSVVVQRGGLPAHRRRRRLLQGPGQMRRMVRRARWSSIMVDAYILASPVLQIQCTHT
jgi:hypothetical protein